MTFDVVKLGPDSALRFFAKLVQTRSFEKIDRL